MKKQVSTLHSQSHSFISTQLTQQPAIPLDVAYQQAAQALQRINDCYRRTINYLHTQRKQMAQTISNELHRVLEKNNAAYQIRHQEIETAHRAHELSWCSNIARSIGLTFDIQQHDEDSSASQTIEKEAVDHSIRSMGSLFNRLQQEAQGETHHDHVSLTRIWQEIDMRLGHVNAHALAPILQSLSLANTTIFDFFDKINQIDGATLFLFEAMRRFNETLAINNRLRHSSITKKEILNIIDYKFTRFTNAERISYNQQRDREILAIISKVNRANQTLQHEAEYKIAVIDTAFKLAVKSISLRCHHTFHTTIQYLMQNRTPDERVQFSMQFDAAWLSTKDLSSRSISSESTDSIEQNIKQLRTFTDTLNLAQFINSAKQALKEAEERSLLDNPSAIEQDQVARSTLA